MKRWSFIILILALPYIGNAATVVSHNFNDMTWGGMGHNSKWSLVSSGGVDNSPYARLTYDTAGTDGKAMTVNLPEGNVVWVEIHARAVGPVSGGSKYIKFFGKDANGTTSQINNMTLALTYGGNVQERVAYYGDTDCISPWAGSSFGDHSDCYLVTHPVTGSKVDIRGTTWHHYKAWVKRADSGQGNGEVKTWWNGNLVAHAQNMRSNPTVKGQSTQFKYLEFGGNDEDF
jgi:hypothetical protein